MCRFLDSVYTHGVRIFGAEPKQTVQFMDGCATYHTEEAERVAAELGVRVETLPPNCTSILQPCHQHINTVFKNSVG